MNITIAVDAMGGDYGTPVTVPAVLRFLKQHQDAHIILVGLPTVIQTELAKYPQEKEAQARLYIKAASEVVTMEEAPQLALKNKKDSSMRVAINLVKLGEAHACVSAGNTGALMATARFVLKTLPGIDRPAIAKLLPNQKGTHTCMLDLGANVGCSAEQLYQFATMGAMLMSALKNAPHPSVGLLNIGTEELKGGETLREAAELLRQSNLNFYGNVEGDDIFKGTVDVVACDGFVGNVTLKSSEGLVRMLTSLVREAFKGSFWGKLAIIVAYPVLRAVKTKIDPSRYNGASLLGLRNIVIKSHGGADEAGFFWALEQAANEVQAGVIDRINQQMAAAQAIQHAVGAAVPNVIISEAN
jgi:glycerol-3-phosphate acyltransferase PlsX